MGRKKLTKQLNVLLNGLHVGNLTKYTNGSISFKYTEEWIRDGFGISNSLPIQEDEYRGEAVTRYFDNLLPDNDEIRKKIATKFGAESIRPFDLLEVIGRDCVGALSFLPAESNFPETYYLKYSKLSDAEIANKIRNLSSTSPLGMDDGDFRLSIAGAQEKTALLEINGVWNEPHGMTPTTHIFKTSIGALNAKVNFEDSIDNEWASLFLMKKMGLNVCEAKICQFEDQRVLIVKRFDRAWKQVKAKDVLLRIPQEDMCQALQVSPYKKYQCDGGPGLEEISNFLMASKEIEDRRNFFKAIMIFDLFFATDGHAKNFSIFLEPSGFKLTPFYDVMSGYFLHAREKRPMQKLKLAMKIGNSGHYAFHRIRRKHYEESAVKCNLSKQDFEQISSELQKAYEGLTIDKKELDSNLKITTLEIIREGMKIRSAEIFNQV
ncbi:MAG: HipA domain-containing protein [Bdellovibrio sp.]|nr:HipA domain-containing protein [Bdellovibrio sp.]